MVLKRAVVVGAGLSGLSAAIRLALAGFHVKVFDARGGPGGKAFTETLGAWRFDTGPSLLTMVPVFQRLFARAGRRLEDYLTPVLLDPVCHYWFADGTIFRAGAGPEGLTRSMVQAGLATESEMKRFLAYSRRLYEVAGPLFLENALDSRLVFRPAFWKSLFHLPSLDAGRTMMRALEDFFHDARARQYFGRYATYNGSSPYRAPATLNLIPWVELQGAWGVREGIYAIPKALERLGRELGVEYFYGTRVERIEAYGRQVTGVRLVGQPEAVYADLVVSASDVHETYRLLQEPGSPWNLRYKTIEPSSSGFVFYWGLDIDLPEMGVNNIFFSSDYPREFREIFDEARLPIEPTIYVNIGSKITPEDAPPGGSNWFVLVNAPWNRGQDWVTEGKALRERLLDLLERRLGRAIRPHIRVEGSWSPPEIEALTSSRGGSLYGISSNSAGAAFRRHPNRHPEFRGLYLCGGSAHPGGGMPLAVLSGEIAAELAAREVR